MVKNETKPLSLEEIEEIGKFVNEQSAIIAGTVISKSIERFGKTTPAGVGVAVDILAQATGRVAGTLVPITGQKEMIIDHVMDAIRKNIDMYSAFLTEMQNVAVEERKE